MMGIFGIYLMIEINYYEYLGDDQKCLVHGTKNGCRTREVGTSGSELGDRCLEKWKILAPVNGSHGGFKSTHLIWDVVRMDLW